VTPDIMTMAKALTNGAQPMGAVAVKDEIYETITGAAPENAIEFFHGYTYSGHPAACAAGNATQDIYQQDNLFERAGQLSGYFGEALHSLKDLECLKDIRSYGLLGAVEVKPQGGPGALGTQLQKDLFWSGLHVKFTGDSGIIAPPFVAEEKHIDEMIDKLRKTLSKI
jgi:beta-alanine--pyruvate transaminase